MNTVERPTKRRFKRILLGAAAAVPGTLLLFAGVLMMWSPGVPNPVLDAQGHVVTGSLSEKTFVDINGTRQGMFLRSRDTSNPVLLFLHGGPGMPEYFLDRRYPSRLEEVFTVCWWEQRGAGLSFSPDIPSASISFEQHMLDAIEVTQYLRRRFGKDKIYLLGHSNGSFLAIQVAARTPQFFHAYVGVAQVSHQLRSEHESFAFMLEQFRSSGDNDMVRRLEAAPVGTSAPLPEHYLQLRDEAMHKLGVGTTRDMRSVVTGVFLATWTHPSYTFGEKIDLWRGRWSADSDRLWNEMLTTDLTTIISELNIPVYYFHGIHDRTVSYHLARDYFDRLRAPVKRFYTFHQSAHSPIFEEAERSLDILISDVLTGTNGRADEPTLP